MLDTDTIIVGAGPAGLAVAGRLARMGIPFLLIEKGNHIAASWHDHYERLCLHTVKEHSDLPHWPMPENYPVYVSRLDLITYWENYARQMGITPVFEQEVRRVHRADDAWIIETAAGKTYRSARAVIATGYNRVPRRPQWPGQDQFEGKFLHSCAYRNAAPFRDQKVLLIGIGNTGAELALDLCDHGAQPFISVRSPVNFIRRDIAGRPAQRTAILLGKLPASIADFIARQVQKLTVGDLRPYGIPASPYAPSEQLRRFGKVPVIDIGTIDRIRAGKIKILPDVSHFNRDSVTFSDGRTETFDAVIACTGYLAQIEDFVENGAALLNERGYPRSLWFEEASLGGLYFCGFSTPLSGILRNIKIDSEKIAEHIRLQHLAGNPESATS